MSYKSWSVYGYGFCAEDIVTTKEKLLSVVHEAPEFEEELLEWLLHFYGGGSFADFSVEEILDFEDDYGNRGIAAILQAVIEEKEHINLHIIDGYSTRGYLLLEPGFPWHSWSEAESQLTDASLCNIIQNYVQALTDQDINIGYQEIECGG